MGHFLDPPEYIPSTMKFEQFIQWAINTTSFSVQIQETTQPEESFASKADLD